LSPLCSHTAKIILAGSSFLEIHQRHHHTDSTSIAIQDAGMSAQLLFLREDHESNLHRRQNHLPSILFRAIPEITLPRGGDAVVNPNRLLNTHRDEE
jgi:hypothetical protein